MAREKVPGYLIVGKIISYAMYIWVLFGIIILGLRVFLLAFSANATTPFVNFIYTTSANFMNPFREIFPPKSVSTTGYLDVAAIFAIIIYALIGWGFSMLVHYIQSKIDAVKRSERRDELIRQHEYEAQHMPPEARNSARPPGPARTSRPPKQL